MAVTQRDLALQMVAQLRLLDPSASAEVGTPERKLIDTFGQAMYDSSIDLDALQQELDVDSKYGAGLDRFLGIFNFRRIAATYATGFVTFSRPTPSNFDIRIPANTLVQAPGQPASGDAEATTTVQFFTTFDVVLPAGSTSVVAPIRATVSGLVGNVATNTIAQIVGTPPPGITTVINDTPTNNGHDSESDNEFKVRFKNTVFRNLAGTRDQFLALGIATAYTTKANVVGPQSRYREYIQVPPVDDTQSYDIDGNGSNETGGGATAGLYTSAISTIPYAKALYTTTPVFVSNGDVGINLLFYRQDTDFIFNTSTALKNKGDALRLFTAYGASLVPDPSNSPTQPDITFNNVYTGTNASIQAIRPNDVVLLEFMYMSEASRNDLANNISNCVDVFIDGGNDTIASTIMSPPSSVAIFVDDSTSKFHYENYRRVGNVAKRPILGNVLSPLFWEPITDLPEQIVVNTDTYFKGIHYWAVEDVSNLAGTIRSRSGIEWSTKTPGKSSIDADTGPYTGTIITAQPISASVEVDGYSYDKNVVDLQAAYDGSSQITTDVLAHKARFRYFKFDVTIMYSQGAAIQDTNVRVSAAIRQFLESQFFGAVIQLSDILQVIHGVDGVDNVRWSSDMPNSPDLGRVFETDLSGQPILGVTVDRIQPGAAVWQETQGLYLAGQPTSGSFLVNYNAGASQTLNYNLTAAQLQTALRTATGDGSLTVTEDTRSTTNVKYPIRSFRITFGTLGAKNLITVVSSTLAGGPRIINTDFIIRDNELATIPTGVYTPVIGIADAAPGLIIRPRAQNTYLRA